MLLLKMVLDEKAQYQNLSYALVMFGLEGERHLSVASFTNNVSGALYEANIVSVTCEINTFVGFPGSSKLHCVDECEAGKVTLYRYH